MSAKMELKYIVSDDLIGHCSLLSPLTAYIDIATDKWMDQNKSSPSNCSYNEICKENGFGIPLFPFLNIIPQNRHC